MPSHRTLTGLMRQARMAVLTLEELVDLAGETRAEDVTQLALRGQGIATFAPYADQLTRLESLSVSHNSLATLDGFGFLTNLVTLNVNNNQLSSLAGLEQCCSLQQLYAARNQIRDLGQLVHLTQLQTLNVMGNAVASLNTTMQVLTQLQSLTDLDISANPVATVADAKRQLLWHIPWLTTLDGDRVTDVDRQMAAEWGETTVSSQDMVTTNVSINGNVDILVIDTSDEPAAPSSIQTQRTQAVDHQSDTGAAVGATPQLASGTRPVTPAGVLRPMSSWGRPDTAWKGAAGPRPGTACGYTQQLCSDPGLNDHPLLLEYLAKHVLSEGLAVTGPQGQSALSAASRRRASFATRLRTTASVMSGTERLPVNDPQTSDAVQALLKDATPQELIRQLVRLAEVLIKEVESLRRASPVPGPGARAVPSRPGSATPAPPPGPGALAIPTRMSSPVPPAAPAHPYTPSTQAAHAPHHPATTTAKSLCDSVCRPDAGPGSGAPQAAECEDRPGSGTTSNAPVSATVSVNVSSPLVTAGSQGAMEATASHSADNGSSGFAETVSGLQLEVLRLKREVKQLQLENQNMYWLADEYKRLKAELAALRPEADKR